MFQSDDPARLLGQDYHSVVAMLADATARADPWQLAETRAMFALVSGRAERILPPVGARHTAALILGPVAAFAVAVEQIDDALRVAYDWLLPRPTCVLRALGRAFEPLDRTVEALGSWRLEASEERAAEIGAEWEERFHEASVLVRLGPAPCRIVACGDMLQIRVQDPETGWYLTSPICRSIRTRTAIPSLPFPNSWRSHGTGEVPWASSPPSR
jgi:hypothetical protein